MRIDTACKIAHYYDDKIALHGPCARGVDWRDEASQTLRFSQFERLLPMGEPYTILDIGCGYGALLTHLRSQGYNGCYQGIDLSPAMIDQACALHRQDSQAQFENTNLISGMYDYIVMSGIFNVRMDISIPDWEHWIDIQFKQIFSAARLGIAVNFLSDRADQDKQRTDLYYANPCSMLQRALVISRHTALLHDYGLWEFTLLITNDR